MDATGPHEPGDDSRQGDDFPSVGFPPIEALDEKALRRPGWSGHRWVVLGDGGQWALPRVGFPELYVAPQINEAICEIADRSALIPRVEVDPADPVAVNMALWRDASERTAILTAYNGKVATALLAMNYHMTADQAWSLMPSGGWFDISVFAFNALTEALNEILQDTFGGDRKPVMPLGWPAHDGILFHN